MRNAHASINLLTRKPISDLSPVSIRDAIWEEFCRHGVVRMVTLEHPDTLIYPPKRANVQDRKYVTLSLYIYTCVWMSLKMAVDLREGSIEHVSRDMGMCDARLHTYYSVTITLFIIDMMFSPAIPFCAHPSQYIYIYILATSRQPENLISLFPNTEEPSKKFHTHSNSLCG